MGEVFVDVETQTEPEPWGPEELVAFATSMAGQVAQKLSQHEERAQGVVDRFAEDLRRLRRDPWEAHQEATAGAWHQGTGDLIWWPMWWCPGSPQWTTDGAGAMLQPVTRLPLRGRWRQRIGSWRHLCRQGRVDPPDPTAEGARKQRRGRGQWCRRSVNRTMSRRLAHGHPAPATTGLTPQGRVLGQPPRMKADGRTTGCVAPALNQNLAPS